MDKIFNFIITQIYIKKDDIAISALNISCEDSGTRTENVSMFAMASKTTSFTSLLIRVLSIFIFICRCLTMTIWAKDSKIL